MVAENLNPDQFLYHGTTRDVGDKVLPAIKHGKGSFWGDAGSGRGEPSQEHAWAVPDEKRAWDFAMDRVVVDQQEWNPRARVYAVHQHPEQSPGHDASIPGEIKSPEFDVAERKDIMPGRQGTFPDVNWNNHMIHLGLFADDEDANHPRNLSVQFGHRYGRWGDHWNGPLRADAKNMDDERYIDRLDAIDPHGVGRYVPNEDALPGLTDKAAIWQMGRKKP